MALVSSMPRLFIVDRTVESWSRNRRIAQHPLPMYGESGREMRAVVSLWSVRMAVVVCDQFLLDLRIGSVV